jgi:hypothetical protein
VGRCRDCIVSTALLQFNPRLRIGSYPRTRSVADPKIADLRDEYAHPA